MVSKHLVEQFRRVLAEDYGKEVSVEKAEQILGDLVAYFDLLAKLYHRSQRSNLNNDNTKETNELEIT